MSVSMDLQNQCSYQSPDGWTIAWSQDAIEIHQLSRNKATASDIFSDTNSSDTASTASVQYTGISTDASSSTSMASENKDEWFTPAQFVPSETFPYFNGSASYIPNRDMSVQLIHDNKDGCLINLTESLDELVTNAYNNMFVNATPSPLPEVVQVTSTIKNAKLKKRFRTAYTTYQVNAMEQEFRKQSYLSKPDREKLCERIGVSDRALKVWFQNRRMKEKINESTEQISKTLQVTTNNQNVTQVTIDNSDVQQDFVHTPSSLVEEIGQLRYDFEPNNADQLVHCSNTIGVDFNIERSETTLVNTTEYEPISPPDGHTIEITNWRKNENDEIKTLLDFNFCS